MPRADAHFTDRAADYAAASQRGLWAWWRRRERRAIMSLLRPRRGESLLDAGCGAGYYAEYLSRAGYSPMATDFLPAMTRQLHERLPSIPVFVSDLHSLPLRPTFDAVLCAGALEFCARPEVALASLSHSLRVGGRLVVMLPAAGLPGHLYRLYHRRNGVFIRLFDLAWLRRQGRRAGLRLVAYRSVGFNLVARFQRMEEAPR